MEFEGLRSQKHFMSLFPEKVKKLRFDFKNWPKKSRFNTWWYKMTSWRDVEEKYTAKQFEECINWMIQNYRNGTSFQFGQTGGGEFELTGDDLDEVIIPYLHFEKTTDQKEKVCLIDLG